MSKSTTTKKRHPGRCDKCGAPVPPPGWRCAKCKRATRRAANRRRAGRFVAFSRGAAGPSLYAPYRDPERDALAREDDMTRLYDAVETGGL